MTTVDYESARVIFTRKKSMSKFCLRVRINLSEFWLSARASLHSFDYELEQECQRLDHQHEKKGKVLIQSNNKTFRVLFWLLMKRNLRGVFFFKILSKNIILKTARVLPMSWDKHRPCLLTRHMMMISLYKLIRVRLQTRSSLQQFSLSSITPSSSTSTCTIEIMF